MSRMYQDSATMMPVHGLTRDERAARAINTVNKTIPEHLRTSPRARHGIHNSVEIIDPPLQREDSPTAEALPQIRIRIKDTDTLSAARQMTYSSRRASMSTNANREQQMTRRVPNVCILNQAAAIKPGGGFLEGIHSQEEFLCQRSTLYASLLRENLYPLPEVGGVWSPDILVFGDSSPEAEELQKRDRVFVDVITACMIRFPGAARWRHDGDTIRPGCSCGVSYCDMDRDLVMSKMRAVLRIAQAKGSEKLVLGAWGCGLYGNPPREVARLWKKSLFGTSKAPVSWPGIKEVVFAINDKPSLREFEKCFADLIASQAAESLRTPPPERSLPDISIPKQDPTSMLVLQISDLETQIATTTNNRTRHRLRDQLTNLNKKLADLGTSESPTDANEDEDDDAAMAEESDFVMHGYPASDGEDNSYYNFDENDVASSDESATPASVYEFRFEPASRVRSHDESSAAGNSAAAMEESYVHAVPSSEMQSPVRRPARMSSFEEEAEQRRRLDESGGWFSGSVNQLSALMRKTGAPAPALSPADPRPEDAHFPEY